MKVSIGDLWSGLYLVEVRREHSGQVGVRAIADAAAALRLLVLTTDYDGLDISVVDAAQMATPPNCDLRYVWRSGDELLEALVRIFGVHRNAGRMTDYDPNEAAA